MPIYEYKCTVCGKIIERMQKVNEEPPITCPFCGSSHTLKKLVSQTSFELKGSGWYATDYKNNSSTGEKPKDNNKKGETNDVGKNASNY